VDTTKLFSLEGRIALVTGGSRNLGKTIARAYIAQGATVYISSRKAADCDATAAELGPNCHALPQDVSTMEGVQALAAALAEREDRLDILVNNAGAAWGVNENDSYVYAVVGLFFTSLEEWQSTFFDYMQSLNWAIVEFRQRAHEAMEAEMNPES
jgi:NAD(P)-dependent dehydrogenase (short-subunit alcohol dehydrogenase family)